MPPVVILLYNDISAPGGLCDRLRSMCGTYKVCCELGLQYKIGHFIPFALSDFLQPNSVDWRISESDIIKDLKQIEVIDYTPWQCITRREGSSMPTAISIITH